MFKKIKRYLCKHKETEITRTTLLEPVYGPSKNKYERGSIVYWKMSGFGADSPNAPIKEYKCLRCGKLWTTFML